MTINSQEHPISAVQNLLKYTYGIVPIVAGADKFTNLLTDWEQYLSPAVVDLLPFSASTFMLIVGVIEIAAGILVLIRPRLGAYVVAAWLVGIALNLLLSGRYFDIAVRDLVMAVGAYCLGRLSAGIEHRTSTNTTNANRDGSVSRSSMTT